MPTTFIPKIGDVEYTSKALPSGIKGKTMLGELTAPILISEDLGPGAKLDYVVAHEIGHRLTVDMMIGANSERPDLFRQAPKNQPSSALLRYFITLGLKESDLDAVHPGTRAAMHRIFEDNALGLWTPELQAREFIAEVYANWATGKGRTPPEIAKRFKTLTDSKNEFLSLKGQEAAFDFHPVTSDEDFRWAILLLGGLSFAVILLS